MYYVAHIVCMNLLLTKASTCLSSLLLLLLLLLLLQPGVINGASDLMKEVFGDKGVHSRSAVGTNALPLNIPVEIEAIVEVEA
jgi:enamine deaminase RidA (YjgF/YER057c/UK114 family)